MPWIGGRDDLIDSALIESLVPIISLQDLEMGAERALLEELFCLRLGDLLGFEQPVHAFRINGPLLAASECLLQIRKVRERRHGVDPRFFQLVTRGREIKLTLQVVHPRLQKGFAMERAPKTDRPLFFARHHRFMREIMRQFFG